MKRSVRRCVRSCEAFAKTLQRVRTIKTTTSWLYTRSARSEHMMDRTSVARPRSWHPSLLPLARNEKSTNQRNNFCNPTTGFQWSTNHLMHGSVVIYQFNIPPISNFIIYGYWWHLIHRDRSPRFWFLINTFTRPALLCLFSMFLFCGHEINVTQN